MSANELLYEQRIPCGVPVLLILKQATSTRTAPMRRMRMRTATMRPMGAEDDMPVADHGGRTGPSPN